MNLLRLANCLSEIIPVMVDLNIYHFLSVWEEEGPLRVQDISWDTDITEGINRT